MAGAEHSGVFDVFRVFRDRSVGFVGGFGCEGELEKRKDLQFFCFLFMVS